MASPYPTVGGHPTPPSSAGDHTTSSPLASAFTTLSVSALSTPVPCETSGPSALADKIDYLNHGLDGVERRPYPGPGLFSQVIEKHTSEFDPGNTSQYLVFSNLTTAQLTRLEHHRDRCHKGCRFFYLMKENVLVVKTMPGSIQELAHRRFDEMFAILKYKMELQEQIIPEGASTYRGTTSTKEADTAHRPVSNCGKTDWPTIVYECGFSKSLARLVVDAHWWLETTGGEVKIAIVISVDPLKRKLHLEKWEGVRQSNTEVTQAHPNTSVIRAMKTQEVDILGTDVRGAPLEFSFEKVMNRKPGESEGNFVFTSQDLESYAGTVWKCLP